MGTDDDREYVRSLLDEEFGDRVFDVGPDLVWVSGMNSSARLIAREMSDTLDNYGIQTGPVHDDRASEFGGYEFRYNSDTQTPVDGLALALMPNDGSSTDGVRVLLEYRTDAGSVQELGVEFDQEQLDRAIAHYERRQ